MVINWKHNRIEEIIEWTTYGMIEGEMQFSLALLDALEYLEIPHNGLNNIFVNVDIINDCEHIVRKWRREHA